MTTNSLNNEVWSDFTVKNGASGSLRKLSVQNNYNAASTASLVEHYIAGTTASDPYTASIIGTTASYALGIDVDDSQALKLGYNAGATATPSSTCFFESDTDCHNYYPLQPCFRVVLSNNYNNMTGDNTNATVPWDQEDYDIGNNFNTGTYTFTAPIDGRYFFTTTLWITGVTSAHNSLHQYLYINAAQFVKTVTKMYNFAYTNASISLNLTHIADLSASDTVITTAQVFGSSKVIVFSSDGGHRSFFAGYLVG